MKYVRSMSKISYSIPLLFLVLNCFTFLGSHAQLIPQQEVETLQTISRKLGNKHWDVTASSCSKGWGFNRTFAKTILSNVTCDCTFSNNTCHVTTIQLKGLNLTGTFPAEFGNLTYLREIDLSQNYINGTIPTSLTRIPLVILSVLGNRLSGSIPEEIGDISTLEQLVLEDNLLGGPLPEKLGNLSRLSRLLLSANLFNGSIPETFGQLKNLTEFRIDGSGLSGKIPDFIGNWTNITRLDFQGTSMEGPIPSTISLLKNLKEL